MQRLLLLTLIAAAFAAFGGAYPWATAPLTAGAALVAISGGRRTFAFPRQFRILDLALIATAIAIALQATPLPAGIVDALSPQTRRLRATLRIDAVLRDGEALPLSIDVLLTLQALATFAAAVLVFWSARALFARGGTRSFCRTLAAIGIALTIVAIVQRAVTPDLIYGFWRPADAGAHPLGPFVNRNHFAAALLMILPVVAGYVAARTRTRTSFRERGLAALSRLAASAGALFVFGIGLMLLMLIATLSRSALLGFGAAVAVAFLLAAPRVGFGTRAAVLWLATAGVTLLVAMVLFDLEAWAQRFNASFQVSPAGRLTIWRESMDVVRDFWSAGVGAGAYGPAMLVYQQSVLPMPHLRNFAHFNQAHSHYVQLLVEGGLLVTIPVVVAIAATVAAAARALAADRGEITWIRVGGIAALAGVAVQSIWETALRMPANAFLFAAIAALAIHTREERSSTAGSRNHVTIE